MYFEKDILIVDDSLLIRSGIQKLLQESGYIKTEMAFNGIDAKSKLAEKHYDLVLSDYDMPEMNGKELTHFIKASYPDMIVIILSAESQKELLVELMREADNFVIKDNLKTIKTDLLFNIQQAFDKQKLVFENRELLEKLKEKDRKMQKELDYALYLLKSIYEVPVEESAVFKIEVFNHLSNTIGGDYFLVKRRAPDEIALMIADISGHGIPAALLLFTLKNISEDLVLQEKRTNRVIDWFDSRLKKVFPENIFVTASYLCLDESAKTVRYTNEFQNPILYLKKDGSISELDNGKIRLLGFHDREEQKHNLDFNFSESEIKLEKGERLFLFTDGITEAKNKEREDFGIDRLKKVLLQNSQLSLPDCFEDLLKKVEEFASIDIADDITIIGIEMV